MIDQYFGILTRSPIVSSTAVLVLLAWLVQYVINRRKKLSVPVVKLGNNKLMEVIVNGKNMVEATARTMVRHLLTNTCSIMTSHLL